MSNDSSRNHEDFPQYSKKCCEKWKILISKLSTHTKSITTNLWLAHEHFSAFNAGFVCLHCYDWFILLSLVQLTVCISSHWLKRSMSQFHNHAQNAPLCIEVRLCLASLLADSTVWRIAQKCGFCRFSRPTLCYFISYTMFSKHSGPPAKYGSTFCAWLSDWFIWFCFLSIENQLARNERCKIFKKMTHPEVFRSSVHVFWCLFDQLTVDLILQFRVIQACLQSILG